MINTLRLGSSVYPQRKIADAKERGAAETRSTRKQKGWKINDCARGREGESQSKEKQEARKAEQPKAKEKGTEEVSSRKSKQRNRAGHAVTQPKEPVCMAKGGENRKIGVYG